MESNIFFVFQEKNVRVLIFQLLFGTCTYKYQMWFCYWLFMDRLDFGFLDYKTGHELEAVKIRSKSKLKVKP